MNLRKIFMNKSFIIASLFAAFASFSLSAPGKADVVSCAEEMTVVENEILGAAGRSERKGLAEASCRGQSHE